jgi:hypothetical protein
VARDRSEKAPVVDPHGEIGEAEPGERLRGGEDQLDLGHARCHPQDVDVALGELAEASLLGALRTPHRTDLDRFQGIGQASVILGIVAGQGHRQVEAKPVLGELASRAHRRLQVLPPLEHLEDELLVLAPLAADEQAQALERRRLDPLEPEGAIHREDLLGGGVAQVDLGRQQVSHAARRGGADLARHR